MGTNEEASKASKKFQEELKELNTDKRPLDAKNIIDVIKTALVEVVELEITTWVSEPSDGQSSLETNEAESIKSGNRMYTLINLIDGDINNEVGSQFLSSGPYTELRDFHLSQVKESREIIQKNIESVQKLFEVLMEMLEKSRKTSQQTKISSTQL